MKIETQNNEKKFSEVEVGEVFKDLDGDGYFMRIPNIKRTISTRTDAVYNAIRLNDGDAEEYDPDCTVIPVDAKVVVYE